MKKVQVKLTIPATMKQDLENVAALTADSIQTLIKGYVRDALYVPKQGPPQSPPPRAHRVAEKKNKKKKKNNNPLTTNETTLSPDFDPPEAIARKYNLEHHGAVKRFRDWATATRRTSEDWNDAFAIACDSWIPQAAPELRLDPERKLYDGDRTGVDAL